MTVALTTFMADFTPAERAQVAAGTAELIRAVSNFASTQVKEKPRGRID
jgi:hypothetical protein